LQRVLSKKEKILVCFFLSLIAVNSVYLGVSYYFKNTVEIPAYGGEYIEGMVGQPRFINSILSQTSDIDSDISSLVYSGLFKLNKEGKLTEDLVENYEIGENNLTYTFHIKKGVKWHDGKELTSDDIVYTIQTIQNPDFNSPLRANWKGIRVEKIDEHTVKFTLKNAYSPFFNNLTFGILPKHLWEFIGANNFLLAEYNLNPIGTGPYKFKQFKKDKDGRINSIELLANKDYYSDLPIIEKITFKFFKNEDDVISAFNRKEIRGINYISPKNKKRIAGFEDINIYRLKIPRYFAVFFNKTKSKALSDKTVRLALAYAVDKNRLIEDILDGEGSPVETPIPPQVLGYNPRTKIYDYAKQHAKNILEADGWIDSNGDGIREKDGTKIEFTLFSTDRPNLVETSKLLKEMWKDIGADVSIKNVSTSEIQNNYIKPRAYEALLFGEMLNYDPDPFSFWHSSQKKDPGLNLSLYDNMEVDKLLEEARQETDRKTREEKYKRFQEIVVDDLPAVFLYSPNYLYVHSGSVRGFEPGSIVVPSDRFGGIEKWYVKTKRVWK